MMASRKLRPLCRLDRYVAAHFISSYGAAMGLMMGMFLVLDLAGNVDDWFEPWSDGTAVSTILVARYCLLNLPYQFLQIAPFITLIAGMFTVNRMLKKNEISAILSAGISVHRMLVPVYAGGIAIAIGMFGLREAIRLGLADERDTLRYVLDEHRPDRVIENQVVREPSGSIVVLDRFMPGDQSGGSPRVEGLTLRLRQGNSFLSVRAPSAHWIEGELVLNEGRQTVVAGDVKEVRAVERMGALGISPEVILTYHRAHTEPLELAFSEVRELMRREPENPAWKTLWHYHLTFPLANLVLLLVGLPLMFDFRRGRGTERMAMGGVLCVLYFSIDFVMRNFGLSGGLSPVLASWLPALIFSSLGVVLTDAVKS